MVLTVDSVQVMPILIFLSSIISILYYIGFMPWLICKVRKAEYEVCENLEIFQNIYQETRIQLNKNI